MNYFERELENAGYDEWKTQSGKPFTFVKKKGLGKCPKCGIVVYEDELFVEEDGEIYHYKCYNEMKENE